MTVKTIDIVRGVITVILLLFHFSVTWFIFWMRVIRKNKLYTSHFYLLYLMISIADIATIINTFLVQKVVLVEAWKPWFLAHPEWNTVFWLFSGYLIYFQSLLHAAIAINRAWISFYINVNKSYASKAGKIGTWFLPFVALAIAAPRIPAHSVYVISKENELAGTYVESYAQVYHSIAGPSVVLSTCLISFIFAIATILRYQHLFKMYQHNFASSMKHDVLLFFQAFTVLFFQLALAGYYIMSIIARTENLPELQAFAFFYFGYVTDALSLCNPIALLIVCDFIRWDYFSFIYQGSKALSPIV